MKSSPTWIALRLASGRSPLLQTILLLVLLLPLLQINVRNNHDWGGDFAMYLIQAQNIVEGQAQAETGYLYNIQYPELGPPAYPIGFPLLLAPVLAFLGNSMAVLTSYIALFLLLWVFISSSYWKQQQLAFPEILILGLLMGYSPWILNFKDEILSDLPFAAFLMLLVRMHGNPTGPLSWYKLAGLGLLAGFLVSIRAAAWPVVGALFIFQLVSSMKSRMPPQIVLSSLLIPGLAFLCQWLLNEVVFQVPQAPEGSYLGIWGNLEKPLHILVLSNLELYLRVLEDFFHPANTIWGFTSILVRQFALVSIILGAIIHFGQRWRLAEYLIVLYLGMILVYPYQAGGFRLILPLLPFLLEYAVTGLRSIRIPSRLPYYGRALLMALFLAFTYSYDVYQIVRHSDQQQDGPQKDYAQEMFQYLKSGNAQVTSVLFAKPRVLAYYAGVPSIAPAPDLPVANLDSLIQAKNISHLLLHRNRPKSILAQYVQEQKDALTVDLQNEKLLLYKIATH